MPGEAEATEKSLVRTSLCKTPIPLHYLPMLHHTHPHKHRMLTPRYQKRMKDSSSTQACHYVRLHGYCTKSMVNSQKEVNHPLMQPFSGGFIITFLSGLTSVVVYSC